MAKNLSPVEGTKTGTKNLSLKRSIGPISERTKGGIRDKVLSKALSNLAKSSVRIRKENLKNKNNNDEDNNQDSDEYRSRFSEAENLNAKLESTNSLLSILPRPKNSSASGPTVEIDKLLKKPKLIDVKELTQTTADMSDDNQEQVDSNIVDVDASKCANYDMTNQNQIKELTVENSRETSNIIVPRGKEKQKNQITYIAQLGKASELEQKERAAVARANKVAARSKYGW